MTRDFFITIREKYHKMAKKYGYQFFDLNALEKRIQFQKRSRSNDNLFNLFKEKEMELFEESKAIAIQRSKAKQKKEDIRNKVTDAMEKSELRIKKYPKCFFNINSSIEIRYFIGAIKKYYDKFHDPLYNFFRGSHEGKELSLLFTDLEKFYFNAPDRLSSMLQKYVDEIRYSSSSTVGAIDRNYLLAAGKIIYKIHCCLKMIQDKLTSFQKEQQVMISYKNEDDVLSQKSILLEKFVQESIDESNFILEDFRLLDMIKWSLGKYSKKK